VTSAALAAVASARESVGGSGGRRSRAALPKEFRGEDAGVGRSSLDGRVRFFPFVYLLCQSD
jgi:hypothetical protein